MASLNDMVERVGVRQMIASLLSGEGVKVRALRSIFFTIVNYGGGNILRLISNLILTRLLFPEAFGLLALVQVFITGLQMFSDTGIRVSIMQSKRGDDPDFLNTAWTIQVIRGFFLWLGACVLAYPAASFYGEPMLAQLLPVVGLNALISGFASTNVATANRHMKLGLLTRIDLSNQVVTLVIMTGLAYLYPSVWALVIGGLIGNVLKVLRYYYALPGLKNKFHWEREAFTELFSFGKFIFFSTLAGFMINQGDKLILGAYITMGDLGVYNIAIMLASIPFALSSALGSKVVFPLYREKPPAESPENQRKIFKARRQLTAGLLCINALLVFGGIWLVDLMYDDRYTLAGPMVVMISFAMVSRIVLAGYGNVLLSSGDSRRHFIQLVSTAIIQLGLMFIGVNQIGIAGVILAPAIAPILLYPMRMRFMGLYKAWDPLHDALFMMLGMGSGALACWLHWDAISLLF